MAELNQLDNATHRFIRANNELQDFTFQKDPLISYARQNVREDYDGGRLIAENFWYDGLIGGPYAKGKEFDTTQPQVEQSLQFTPRFFQVGVTLYQEDIEVLNSGSAQIYPIIESRIQNAYSTIGAHMALSIHMNGQNANYTANWNGLAEALNDNSTASWDGNTYETYGTITRGGAVGSTINSVPTNVAGTIEYTTMEETYAEASYGGNEWEPNMGLTTYFAYSFIKERFQTQQRFNNIQDPKIGFTGLEFNNAVIMRSRYVPGRHLFNPAGAGTADTVAVTLMEQMSNGALTAYPVPAAYTSGYYETFYWLNARKPHFNFYVSTSAKYGFGFTGWKWSAGNTKLIGQILFSGQVTFAPRYHKQLYGITG